MLILTVKGDALRAASEAIERGIEGWKARESKAAGYTMLEVPDTERERIVAWFCEPGAAPFRPGTLMLYRESAEVES